MCPEPLGDAVASHECFTQKRGAVMVKRVWGPVWEPLWGTLCVWPLTFILSILELPASHE